MAFESIKVFMFDMPQELNRKPPELTPADVERMEFLAQRGEGLWQGEHSVPWS